MALSPGQREKLREKVTLLAELRQVIYEDQCIPGNAYNRSVVCKCRNSLPSYRLTVF